MHEHADQLEYRVAAACAANGHVPEGDGVCACGDVNEADWPAADRNEP